MSVYRTARSPYWQYDFQLKGRRFYGSTGVETQRAAREVERRIRERAAKGELDDASQMTLDQAAARWWDEHGSTLKGGDRLEGRIERAINAIGPKTRIVDITTDVVATGIQRRRGMVFAKSAAKNAKAICLKPGP